MPVPISKLPWLPAPPTDLRARCQQLDPADPNVGARIQALASTAFNASQATSLAKAIARCRASAGKLPPLTSFKLGIASNATFDLIADEIVAAAARHGVALEAITAPFDQVMQQALESESDINRARPDAVLLAVDHRWLQLDKAAFETAVVEARVAEAADRLRMAANALRSNCGAPVILATLAVPPQPLFGSFDRRAAGTLRAMIDEVNRTIVGIAAKTGNYLLDVAALAEGIGTHQWFDAVQWNLYKLPFGAEFNAIFADHVGRLLGAIRGKARKCLVLDLDNTIWGGVVGDDGVEALKIGQGSAEGEAFLAVQQMALQLRERGIALAVASKNNDETARAPFREHPDMLLKESHIAVFQANWIDKVNNLEAIAKTLNIGVDALVLLDDNPAERAQVRAALPVVAVPELPSEPSLFPLYLAAAGYFEAVSFSAEDRLRANAYAAETQRAEVLAKAHDLGNYLESLDMAIDFAPFDALGRQRIAQLINKSNQFNLTTRRYTEAEVAALETDPRVYTLQARLRDRFGDLGMISVVICRPTQIDGVSAWEFDSWLMSCRVLGRKVEEAMLREAAHEAKIRGVKLLVGTYIPTAKNNMVNEHYTKLAFAFAGETAEGHRLFHLDLATYEPPALPLAVSRRGHRMASVA